MLSLEINSFELNNQFDFESKPSCFDNFEFPEQDRGMQVDKEEFQDFFLYHDLDEDMINKDSLFTPEDSSTKDKQYGSIMGDIKSEVNDAEKTCMIVPFIGDLPDMFEFEKLIQNDLENRGANQLVCEALEIKDEIELFDQKPQLIKVKKRKTKEQLLALEEEYARNSDWSKTFMNEFADKIGLDPSQVYKWHWDQICKKLGKNPKKKEKAIKKKNQQQKNKKSKKAKQTKANKKSKTE